MMVYSEEKELKKLERTVTDAIKNIKATYDNIDLISRTTLKYNKDVEFIIKTSNILFITKQKMVVFLERIKGKGLDLIL